MGREDRQPHAPAKEASLLPQAGWRAAGGEKANTKYVFSKEIWCSASVFLWYLPCMDALMILLLVPLPRDGG